MASLVFIAYGFVTHSRSCSRGKSVVQFEDTPGKQYVLPEIFLSILGIAGLRGLLAALGASRSPRGLGLRIGIAVSRSLSPGSERSATMIRLVFGNNY